MVLFGMDCSAAEKIASVICFTFSRYLPLNLDFQLDCVLTAVFDIDHNRLSYSSICAF